MATVYQTLDGTFIINEDGRTYFKFTIATMSDNITYYDSITKKVSGVIYYFSNSKLLYTNNMGGVDESVYTNVSKVMQKLQEGTYLGEVILVEDDFLEGWYKHD